MTAVLRYSPDLTLPLDAVTQRFAFLGRIGSGKTYGSTKLAELMLDALAQVVALDPVGLWYGLRVAGKGAGYSLPVFGGLHGDVPLEPGAGAMMADLIVDRALSCVLDVSQFHTDKDKARFAADFADRFFFRKKAAPGAVHLFLEECQEFVPQNPAKGEELMLHHWTRMAKLGRNFGIGLSLISQRPQEVNKKVLNLTECLLAFQMTGAHERKAIKEWIASVGADENILTVLPSLPVGVAHVYSPQWLRVSRQVQASLKRSADVSSTPAVGASPVASKPLTKVDMAALREVMATTIEKAKADDPKELRREIAQLKKELAAKPSPAADPRAIHRVVEAERKAADARVAASHRAAVRFERDVMEVVMRLDAVSSQLRERSAAMLAALQTTEDSRAEVQVGHTSRTTGDNHPSVSAVGQISRAPARPIATPRALVDGVSKGQQKILDALAELEALGIGQTNRTQLGMFAGYNLTGGSGAQHIADLVGLGLVELPDKGAVRLTAAGQRAAFSEGAPASLDELHERVFKKISDGQRRILQHLISIYPEPISRADLGKAVNYNLTGGSGAQHVADLINAGAAVIPAQGKVAASPFLFPEGL